MPEVTRPECCQETHLVYLDTLRDSGVTNMFGGASYLQQDCGLDRQEARKVLSYWMATFSEREEA